MFISTTLLLSFCVTFESPCYDAEFVGSDLDGALSFSAMNESKILTGMIDGSTNRMVVWSDGEVVTEVTTFYDSYGVLVNEQGIAAGLGSNGVLQDDRLIRANANGSFETLASITGSGGWSSLTAMNEQGSIVGNYSGGHGSSYWQPFMWSEEEGLVFIGSGKETAYIRDIDHNNVVTGHAQVGGEYHAMMWSEGVAIDLAIELGLQGTSSGWHFDEIGRVLISEHFDGETRFQWYDPSDSSLVEIYTFPWGSYTLKVVSSMNGNVAFSWSAAGLGPQLARWSYENGFELAKIDKTILSVSVVAIDSVEQVVCNGLIAPFYAEIAMIWNEGQMPTSLHEQVPDTPLTSSIIAANNHGDLLVRGDTLNWILDEICPGDLNDDGSVNVTDLLELLGLWGADGGGQCFSDLDGSGSVDVGDVLVLIGEWGECTNKDL